MSNEVTGKTLHYYQNSLEYRIKTLAFGRTFQSLDSTSTGTASPGSESIAGRAKTTLKIDTDLYKASTTVGLGDLIEGNTYTPIAGVTKQVLGEVETVVPIGKIFIVDGTEIDGWGDNPNPVAPSFKLLNSKITGKTLSISIASSTFKATDVTYEVKYAEYDATSTGTASPNSEVVSGRAKITTKLDCLMYRATAEQIINASPAPVAAILTFDSGATVTGTALFTQMSISDDVNGICKVSYQLEWQGMPTEAGFETLDLAVVQNANIFYEYGVTTNKECNSNVIMLSRSISASAGGDAKVSYDGVLNGVITPGVYS